jgi:hypothetical protein
MRFVPLHLGGFRDVFDLAAAARQASPARWRYYVTSNELLAAGGRADDGCPLFTFRMNVNADLRPRQRSVCALLHEQRPDARVLIVTRGFAGIIRSLYSQYVKFGGSRDFEAFLDRYGSALKQWLDVDYTVGLYRDAFGDQLLVLPYEWLRDDTRGFIAAIEEFLEIEPVEEPVPGGVRNPSLGPSELYWYPRVSRWIVSPVLERLPPERSAPLYSAYAFKILASEQLASGARWISRRLGRTEPLEFPPGYLERFRGRAGCLASSRPHRPYLDEYLVDMKGVEPAEPSGP